MSMEDGAVKAGRGVVEEMGVVRFAFGGGVGVAGQRGMAAEVPVNVVYGTVPYAVMMMTPADLPDFAAGFSLTEGVVARPEEITAVRVQEDADGIRLVVQLAPGRFHGLLARRRSMAGRTSCGVCGIEEIGALPRAERGVAEGRVRLAAIGRALGALEARQALNRRTGAVHAAAWATAEGELACVREDVGRHNALDKLIGACMATGAGPGNGFLVVTSRCSFEMVEKAAAFGAGVLVAISAPTALGVARARHHGMVLVGLARGDGISVFHGAERIEAGAG